jgi:D-alanyl-D-alanine carboxypeptidase/D-alanyl-D-alanine-endopeptidase (penicillin-binding protein 4)
VVSDGSGLSSENRVTARGLATLLVECWRSPAGTVFLESLARSGAPDGSLKRRLAGAGERDRIAAKTGHIHDVNALSGYVLDEEGRPRLAFSLLANRFLERRIWSGSVGNALDDICRQMISWVDRR